MRIQSSNRVMFSSNPTAAASRVVETGSSRGTKLIPGFADLMPPSSNLLKSGQNACDMTLRSREPVFVKKKKGH